KYTDLLPSRRAFGYRASRYS
ncbi:hypothetical protein EVA_22372, partial [gut metagenome]